MAGAAALWLAPGRTRAADATPIRLAGPPTDASAEVYYADAMGFYKRNGFAPDISHLTNGEAVTAGVIGGSIDIGVGQAISIVTAFSKGIPLTVIAGSAVYSSKRAGAGTLFVPRDSKATTGKDLVGKVIGVQGVRGFAQFGMSAWLDATGGDSSTVKFVEMTSSIMGRALAEGRLDAAFIPEPFVFEVAKVAKKIATPLGAVAPEYYLGAFFATTAWAKAHADVVKRFEATIYETAAWANKNHDRTAEILAAAAGIEVESVRNATRTDYATRREPALLQPIVNLAAKYAGITPFPADQIFFQG